MALLAACSADRHENPSYGCDGCKGDCYRGFCLAADHVVPGNDKDAASEGVGTLGDGGLDRQDAGFDDAGMLIPPPDPLEGMACKGNTFESCYTADAATEGHGPCTSGVRLCECPAGTDKCDEGTWGKCVGQVLPSLERCNGTDDDCDDQTDEDVVLGSCAIPDQKGVCAVGEERCQAGMGVTTCEPAGEAEPETCDGMDDDCDGEVDEDTTVACYDADSGCSMEADGSFSCHGLCAPGTRSCKDGKPGSCEREHPPADEVCTDTSGTAADEDCDGKTDEDCSCNNGDSHPCYGGPEGTAGVGTCKQGTQTCTNNEFGACEDERRPGVETCDNDGSDDDCDHNVDEVAGRGEPCTVASNKGRCRYGTLECGSSGLGCMTLSAIDETCNSQDDDCDGKTDETFHLESDVANCGSCGHKCGGAESCCAGTCVDTETDGNDCGSCGDRCGAGLTCCAGKCVDTQTDSKNCETCGTDCGLLGLSRCCGGLCTNPLCL